MDDQWIRQQILGELISAWEENGNFSRVIPALLSAKLGLDAETVEQHCTTLAADGLIQPYEGGWKITAQGMQRGRTK